MDSWPTTREPEKPTTAKGRNEVLRRRAMEQSACLRTQSQALYTAFGQNMPAAYWLCVAADLLDELAAALKP